MSPLTVDHVLGVLADPRSVPDLRLYFSMDTPPGSQVFSGRRFESLGLDGQQPSDYDRFTAADLLAVQCLSVTVPIEVALDLLEGDLGQEIGDLLSRIPADVCLGTEDARPLVQDGREADKAWHLLKDQDDVGWVVAGKLLARKRPHLIPVWDNVVRCAFGRPDGAWLWLDDLLRAREGMILRQLGEMHAAAKVPAEVSLIRILDVVFWMRHRMSHRPSRCPGLLSTDQQIQPEAARAAARPSQPANDRQLMSSSMASDAGIASASSIQWTRVGGVLVSRDDLRKAIGALSALPDSDTIIIKSLKQIASPLADTKYRQLADQYLREHPNENELKTTGLKHPPVRRIAFIRMLERQLHKLDELAWAADVAEDPSAPDALDDTDARRRITQDVVARQGQARFRNTLIRAYEGRCAITGCDSPYALEAAHIRPYRGEHTNDVTNGLLLRADIHALFDLGLLAVNPATHTVVVSDQLPGDHYKSLQGRSLNLPTNPDLRPNPVLLAERWTWFEGKQTINRPELETDCVRDTLHSRTPVTTYVR